MAHSREKRRLVIVESPTKARTIRRFLPEDYKVEASMGHVRDLPASAAEIPEAYKGEPWARLGVRVDRDFQPLYVISPGKRDIVKRLRGALREADEVLIATDEDREGESIGWHLVELLTPKVPVRRMVFHEITEEAIREALEQTRDIDRNLVDAQETRRILDRLVGYTISPLLWKKIAPRLSAGRVQSVAVRLLVQREQERMRFVPAGYWDLQASLLKKAEAQAAPFEATLTHLDGLRVATGRDFDPDTGRLREGLRPGKDVILLSEAEAARLATQAGSSAWIVTGLEKRRATRSPSPPFTTSTLQQEASRKLGLSAKETMRIAQTLYEKGYITYMRTDSTHLANEALDASRKAIASRYGEAFLSPKPRQYKTKSRNAQEAHEAIRPAGKAMRTRSELRLSGREGDLYDLIWKRTVATQMADAVLEFVTARITARPGNRESLFRASGRTVLFPGFFRAYVEGKDDPEAALEDRDQPLPSLAEGEGLRCRSVEASGHETKPPSRYTEATLVKLLESAGIGRPSTYASIIDTIIARGYVRKQGPQLTPTFTAFASNNLLERQFAQLVDTEFTANMEAALDDIAAGSREAAPYLREFFLGDEGIEARVEAGLEALDARAISTVSLPSWDPFVVRVGRFGPYAEGVLEGETRTASLPQDIAPADVSKEFLEELLKEGKTGDLIVGHDPASGLPMLLRRGPYGPYLQLGEDGEGAKPRRVSLPPGLETQEVDEDVAAALLALPRHLGTHPETGEPVEAGIGRYGPYVRHGRTYASLPRQANVLEIGLEPALELLARKETRNRPLRVVGAHPETGEEIELLEGRYGPYVKHGRTNASLKRNQDPETLTLQDAVELLAAREAKKPGRRGRTGGRTTEGRKSSGKRKTPGRKREAKEKAPKATARELARFLPELAPEVAEIVSRLEGMAGTAKEDPARLAAALGRPEEEIRALHRKGMFKLRMAFGKARKEGDLRPLGEPVEA